jgi:arginase family enzyme
MGVRHVINAAFEIMLISNSIDHGVNPFRDWATVTDCGDISNTPFDKLVAIQELEHGMRTINSMKPKNVSAADAVRLITIGGDHTISKFNFTFLILTSLTFLCSFTNSSCSAFDMGKSRCTSF